MGVVAYSASIAARELLRARLARVTMLTRRLAVLGGLGGLVALTGCGGEDGGRSATASTSAAGSATAARATERPRRYRYRVVGKIAVFGFREDGSGTGWGAFFRVTPRLPLQTEVARNRYTLVLRDVNSNKVLSDSSPLNRIPDTRPGTACYLADFDATLPPLSAAHDIGRVRISLERLTGKPLGTSSVQLAAPQVRPVLAGGKRGQGEQELRQVGCLS